MKSDFATLKDEVKMELKQEFNMFKEQIDLKLLETRKELQEQKQTLEEA